MHELLVPFIPGPEVAAAAGVVASGVGVVAGGAAARARTRRGWRTADSRKLFHFIVFSAAVAVQVSLGTAGTAVFGSVIAAIVLWAVSAGEGNPLFEALARPGDAPRRGTFVVVPLVATAVGGVSSNLLFGDAALVGYLVAGWGDAVAEPVGVRWGRHPYRVPSFGGVPARRSLEGSLAVLVFGGLAAWVALIILGMPGGSAAGVALACGAGGSLVEAVSHHGTDNFTLQVAASGIATIFL